MEGLLTELQKLYHQHFFKAIPLSGKLAPIYSKVKKDYREEFYISAVEYYKYKINQQLLNLEFLLITYESKRVGGKVSIKLTANVKNASIMMLGIKNTIS